MEPPTIPGMDRVATLPQSRGRNLLAAGALCVPASLASLGLYRAHVALFPAETAGEGTTGLLWTPLALLLLVVLHEGLHALAARYLAGLAWRRIRLRMMGAMPACTVDGRSSVRAQRLIGVTPFLVTTGGCTLWLLLGGTALTPLLLTIAVVLSAGDLVTLGMLRRFDSHDVVLGSTDPLAIHVFRGCPHIPGPRRSREPAGSGHVAGKGRRRSRLPSL